MGRSQILLFLFLLSLSLYAQNPEWVSYTISNSDLQCDHIKSVAIDKYGNKWIGTYWGGLAKYDNSDWTIYKSLKLDKTDSVIQAIVIDDLGNIWMKSWVGLVKFDGVNWTAYDTSNSGLPENQISSIMSDKSGNMWFGTYKGVAKYDGITWITYNSSNSRLPVGDVVALNYDRAGNIWMAVRGGIPTTVKLAKYDGQNWTIYNSSYYSATSLTIDSLGNKWIGTYGGGIAKFDDTNWTSYTTSNSDLPSDFVMSLVIDGFGNKWLGTESSGLVKFDDTKWTTFTTSNSNLSDDYINSIAIDGFGNKWIGTHNGLSVFKEGGVVLEIEYTRSVLPTEFLLSQNYPNPFNPTTKIKFSVETRCGVSLRVYDVLGNEVATLVNEEKQPGSYEVVFQSAVSNQQFASGIYFYQLRAGSFVKTKKMIVLK